MLSVTNKHARDQNIEFDEPTHKYTVNVLGVKTKMNKSVTKLVHELFPIFNSNEISQKLVKAAHNKPDHKYFNLTQEEILHLWNTKKEKACLDGTFLHKSIEDDANCVEVNNDTVEYTYYKKFRHDHKHLIPFRTEWCIYYEEVSIAGSIDMVYHDILDNSYHIYDWKRCEKIEKSNRFEFGFDPVDHLPNSNFWLYSLQLNIYKYILETKYEMQIDTLYLIVCHTNNNSYLKIKLPDLQNEVKQIFMNLLVSS